MKRLALILAVLAALAAGCGGQSEPQKQERNCYVMDNGDFPDFLVCDDTEETP